MATQVRLVSPEKEGNQETEEYLEHLGNPEHQEEMATQVEMEREVTMVHQDFLAETEWMVNQDCPDRTG